MDIQISKNAAKHLLAFIQLAEDPKTLKKVLTDFLTEERQIQADGRKLAEIKRMHDDVVEQRARLTTEATADGKRVLADATAVKLAADSLMDKAVRAETAVYQSQERVKILLADAANKEKRATALQQEVEEMRNSWAEQEKAAKIARQATDALKAEYEVKLARIRGIGAELGEEIT